MANRNGMPRIPGIMVGVGVALSNTAILIGGLALVTWLWIMNANKSKTPTLPSDAQIEQQIYEDVYAYSAYPAQVSLNHDRVRDAIQRIRDTFRLAREAYRKKIRDLHIALKAGTITREQYRAQHKAALAEFRTAIKARHSEIMLALGVPVHNAQAAYAMPTLP
jgi:hypothetical protein